MVLEQAFILPLPHSLKANPDETETDFSASIDMKLLQTMLEKLHYKKISWDYFFDKIPPSDMGLRLAATKEGDTILHIAVLHNKSDLPSLVLNDSQLSRKRNRYGLTPLELAQFLNREPVLCPGKPYETAPLYKLPGIFIDPSVHCEILKHLSFLSRPIFENDQILYDILLHSYKAKAKDQILPEKTWMGIYFDKEIQQGVHPSVAIRFIDQEVGLGVFTMQRIPPCSYVGEYTGIVRERKRKHLKNKVYCVRYGAWQLGRQKFIIDAEKGGNFARFINHSATPNLSLQSVYWRGMPRMIFIALQEIEEGAQLTFDYGIFFWKECQQTPKMF